MANSAGHGALPYPIKNARYTVLVPYLDADGDPTDPTTPDTEVSGDGGAFADAAEEVTTITGSNGVGYVTLTGAETNYSILAVAFKIASGPKATLMTLYPRVLPVLESGTAQAGAAGTVTLAAGAAAYDLSGCIVRTTGGTGGGGVGGAGNQARVITAYNTSTKVATVVPNWETAPGVDTTYDVLLTDIGVNAVIGRFLRATTDGRTLDVSAGGEAGVDWANVGTPGSTVGLSATTIKTATDVETDTAVIGALGAGLTAIPWNAAWDAEVESEANDALVAQNLDHLVKIAVDTNFATTVHLDSVVGQLADDGTLATFDRTTDSLEAIRNTAPLGTAMRGTDSAALASVCTEARLAELDAANLPTTTDAILADTGTDGVVVAAASKTGYSIVAGGIGSGAHAAAELNAIADGVLDRNMATGTDSGTDSTVTRTVRQALRPARNKATIAGGVLTVKKEDDTTTSWTAAITTTAGNPISESDPT